MFFLLIGMAGIVMKYLDVAPVAAWNWWIILSPFAMAVLWWWWADKSGYTEKKAMQKMEKRKQDRIDKSRDAMGLKPKNRR
jgi:small Trp-rich protein